MNDRNKTQLTHDVTETVALWMDEKGFKPVETEVPLCLGWCADLAGAIEPTQTELIDLKLLERPPTWNERNSEKTKRREWPQTKYVEWGAQRDSLQRLMTCCVEVKTSRGDYCGDRKWTATSPTDLSYVAYPRGLVRPEEWPEGWGVLEYFDGCIKRLRPPTPQRTTIEQQRDVIFSIAIRRDHHTRYARWREVQKEQRLEAAEQKSLTRVNDAARLVLQVVRGAGSNLDDLLMMHSFRDMPEWAKESLKELYGVKPDMVIHEPANLRRLRLAGIAAAAKREVEL